MTSACVADNKPGPAMVNETTAVGPRPVARALTFTRESPSAGALGAEGEGEGEACGAGPQAAAGVAGRPPGPQREVAINLIDFGLARLSDVAGGPQLTESAYVMGTPGYIAPESVWRGSIGPP